MKYEKITFKIKGKLISLSPPQIKYIESNNKILKICEGENEYYIRGILNHLAKNLDDTQFVRSHQSYLVNMNYIKHFHYPKIILKDGTRIIISRSRYKNFLEKYTKFCTQNSAT